MLVVLFVTEDGNAIICRIYDKYHNKMLYKARSILGPERAEDAVQDAFLKLVEKFGENDYADLGDKPGLYFVILVRNHSINILKKEGRVQFTSLDAEDEDGDIFVSPLDSPEETLLNTDALDRLTALIRQMKPAARQLFDYKYIAGYSNIEIAKELGVSEAIVADRIYKAKKRLKEILEREEVNAQYE